MELSELKSEIVDDGTWVPLTEFPGVEVCVRTTDHPDYTGAINLGVERKARQISKNPRLKTEIVLRAAAKHLLLDWKGVTEKGVPVDFDRDTVVNWSKDLRNYSRFLGAVVSAAVDMTNELVEAREDLGNS